MSNSLQLPQFTSNTANKDTLINDIHGLIDQSLTGSIDLDCSASNAPTAQSIANCFRINAINVPAAGTTCSLPTIAHVYILSNDPTSLGPVTFKVGTTAVKLAVGVVIIAHIDGKPNGFAVVTVQGSNNGGGNNPSPGGRPKLTTLLLNNDMSGGGNWRAIPWDTVDADEVSAFDSSSPTVMTVPAGYVRVKFTFYTTMGNVGSNRPRRIDRTRGTSTQTVQLEGIQGVNESGRAMVTRWLPVQTGDKFSFLYFDDGNAPKGSGGFGGPSYAEAEWSTT